MSNEAVISLPMRPLLDAPEKPRGGTRFGFWAVAVVVVWEVADIIEALSDTRSHAPTRARY